MVNYTRLPLNYGGLFKIGFMCSAASANRNFYTSSIGVGLGRDRVVQVLIGWPQAMRDLEEGSFCHLDGTMLPGVTAKDMVLIPRIESVVELCHSSWIPATVENKMSTHGRGQIKEHRLRRQLEKDELELFLTVTHWEWDPMYLGNGFLEFEIVYVAEHSKVGETGFEVLQVGNTVTLDGYMTHNKRDTGKWVIEVTDALLVSRANIIESCNSFTVWSK